MAKIVFIPYHIQGELYSAFSLGFAMADRGHDVHFLTIREVEERVRAQGFGFSPAFATVYPPGKIEEDNKRQAAGDALDYQEIVGMHMRMLETLLGGEIDRAADELKPDLFVVASCTPMVALAAYKTGVPVVLYTSANILAYDPLVAPAASNLVPGRSFAFGLRAWWAWKGVLKGEFSPQEVDAFRGLAKHCGFPFERIDWKTESWPRPDLPELVLLPREFDFPRAVPPANSIFVEPGIDTRRKEVPFPWERLDPTKKLVYGAAGSLASTYHPAMARQFFTLFFEAMALHPELQGVAAIGHYLSPSEFKVPDNVIVANWVPQSDVLQKSAAMLTHGGLASLKDAVYFGVPMVCIPLFFDHPANVARVVYHGLGVRAELKKSTGAEIAGLFTQVLTDPAYTTRIKAMQRIFVDTQARAPGADYLDRLVAKSGA